MSQENQNLGKRQRKQQDKKEDPKQKKMTAAQIKVSLFTLSATQHLIPFSHRLRKRH
jgi:hypothetical protein